MTMNWLKIGSQAAPFVASIVISVLIGVLGFRKYMAPEINEALVEAKQAIKNLATLAGVKSQEYKDAKGIEKIVAADLIEQKLPELQALKVILSPSAWEQIEETIEENPEAVLQLYQKYGHLLGAEGEELKKTFDF